MTETGFDAQLRHFINLMLTPLGALALLALIGLAIAALTSPKLRWVCLALLLWVSSLGFVIREGEFAAPVLASPLNEIRSQGRPICVALLGALVIPAIISPRSWRPHIVSGALLLFFIFEMFLAVRITGAGVTAR